MAQKKRYAVVGVGGRSEMYINAAADGYRDQAELAALCDNNAGRLRLRAAALAGRGFAVPLFDETQFDEMVRVTRPDTVIVTTRDCFHDTYICRAMELGCDVITEKPMTTDAEKCRRILETVRRTGRNLRVTFNYRYSPVRSQVKELLQSGVIGSVLSVEFKWLLDTSHGADYFRRWHRNKVNSGGLLVHKATHHFDLVNWWINSVPARVTALGTRRFYTPEQAGRYGLTRRADRCLNCPESRRCPFHLDLRGNSELKKLYLDNESFDGYQRDRCVFSGEIDIEDSLSASVEYRSGVQMSYALTACSPWEGYHIVFNGARGRIEHVCRENSYVNGDGSVPGEIVSCGTSINVMPHFTRGYFVPINSGSGGHGGGDTLLLDDLFAARRADDPLRRAADYRAGAWSILTGIAANLAIKERRVVEIDTLVSGLELPDYPAAPAWDPPDALPGFIADYRVSRPLPRKGAIAAAALPAAGVKFKAARAAASGCLGTPSAVPDARVYIKARHRAAAAGAATLCLGAGGPCKIWINGVAVASRADLNSPAGPDQFKMRVALKRGRNELIIALDGNGGAGAGVFARFMPEQQSSPAPLDAPHPGQTLLPTHPYLRRRWKTVGRKLAFQAATTAEWKRWSARVAAKLKELTGYASMQRAPLRAVITEERPFEGYRRQRVEIQTEPGVIMPCFVLIPDGAAQPRPAVIAAHGHGSGGKVAVAGCRETPELEETIRTYNYDYGVQFARAGFMVFCPDARGFGERREELQRLQPMSSSCQQLNNMAYPLGQTVTGMWAWDLHRLVDYIQTRPDCDAGRIGCAGLSGGGQQTLWATALDPRIRCAVVSGYFYGYAEALLDLYGNCSCNYVPHLFEYVDMGDIAALIAPRPLLIETGTRDPLNGASGLKNVRSQLAIARRAYRLQGAGRQLKHAVFEGAHRWHGVAAIAWLKQFLQE